MAHNTAKSNCIFPLASPDAIREAMQNPFFPDIPPPPYLPFLLESPDYEAILREIRERRERALAGDAAHPDASYGTDHTSQSTLPDIQGLMGIPPQLSGFGPATGDTVHPMPLLHPAFYYAGLPNPASSATAIMPESQATHPPLLPAFHYPGMQGIANLLPLLNSHDNPSLHPAFYTPGMPSSPLPAPSRPSLNGTSAWGDHFSYGGMPLTHDALPKFLIRPGHGPIHRLPTEMLLEIFALCAPKYQDMDRPWETRTEKETVSLISQRHLLDLAQVCSQWRTVVLCTPLLWNTLEADFTRLFTSERMKAAGHGVWKLLTTFLMRSQDVPLTLYIRATGETNHFRTKLELLARHSPRWRSFKGVMDQDTMQLIGGVKGMLPMLERLCLEGNGLATVDLFEVAPHLKWVHISGVSTPQLPWGQLLNVYLHVTEKLKELLATAMPSFPYGAVVQLDIYATMDIEPADLPPVVSSVFALSLSVSHEPGVDSPEHTELIVSGLLGALTLPHMRRFTMHTPEDTPWPASSFMELASRSKFCQNLMDLELLNVAIPATDLIQCLGDLKALRALTLSDIAAVAGRHEEHLILTDTLFRRLAFVTDPAACLVPRLSSFQCFSQLRFTHNVLLEFVDSRLESGRDQTFGPFELGIHRQVGVVANLDLDVARALELLRAQGQLA
ncbi:hypothetical protein C8R43DRAFT_638840 [Mycena crocata]|nr:hypothetical protein C8R43DRAFT_638840 [Mycena crocata]